MKLFHLIKWFWKCRLQNLVSFTFFYDCDKPTPVWIMFGAMMTSSNGNCFRVTGSLCGEFTGHRWFPCTKTTDVDFYVFFFGVHLNNSWVNNLKAGDLRRDRAHYDVTVMPIGNKPPSKPMLNQFQYIYDTFSPKGLRFSGVNDSAKRLYSSTP